MSWLSAFFFGGAGTGTGTTVVMIGLDSETVSPVMETVFVDDSPEVSVTSEISEAGSGDVESIAELEKISDANSG